MLVARCLIPFSSNLQFEIFLATISSWKEEKNLRSRNLLHEIKRLLIMQITGGKFVDSGAVRVVDNGTIEKYFE